MRLLDTTALIHYWGGVDAVGSYLESNEGHEFVTTTLNIKEIAVGRKLQEAFDPQELLATFDWVTTVPFESEHAFHAAEMEAGLRRDDGINRDKNNSLTGDLLIAAVAKAENAPVVTRNTDDFEQFPGVSVESY
ncbi:type II toxin-antitoxin system VapC family toxin [Halovenus halobia]|uniref:type II toxin-antitoxin system VapC family toxin n=1 Tax=Halovenus halobia TaxID=3396622 RepID=UPI003F572253